MSHGNKPFLSSEVIKVAKQYLHPLPDSHIRGTTDLITGDQYRAIFVILETSISNMARVSFRDIPSLNTRYKINNKCGNVRRMKQPSR